MENVNEKEKINNLPFKILVVYREGDYFARIVYDNNVCVDGLTGIHRVNCPEIDLYDLYLRGCYSYKNHVVVKTTHAAAFKWKEKISRIFAYEQ
jgi:hypothetical protein